MEELDKHTIVLYVKLYQFTQLINNRLDISPKEKYEIRNCLERFCLSSANFKNESLNIRQKFIEEINEKCANKEKSKLIISDFLNVFEKIKCDKMLIPIFNDYKGEKYLYLKEIHKTIKIPQHILYKFSNLINIIPQLSNSLIYNESLLPGSQHWKVNVNVHSVLRKLGFNREGFASVQNCYFHPLTHDYYEHFCSISPHDEIFGGIGSIFDQDISEFGTQWTFHLPYVEDIIEKVHLFLQEHPTAVISLGLPNWKDLPILKYVNENASFIHVLKPHEYYFQDSDNDTFIKANFGSIHAIFNLDMLDNEKLELINAWKRHSY